MKVSNGIIGWCLIFGLITPPASSQLRNRSPDIQEIKRMLTRQASDWNDGNIEKYMEGYWKSDSLLFTSGGNVRRGWKPTLEKYKKSYDSKEKMGALRFSDLDVNLLSPESAWVFGHWRLDRANDRPGGVFTLLLRKFPGGWKIIHDHTSSYPSPDTAKTSQ